MRQNDNQLWGLDIIATKEQIRELFIAKNVKFKQAAELLDTYESTVSMLMSINNEKFFTLDHILMINANLLHAERVDDLFVMKRVEK